MKKKFNVDKTIITLVVLDLVQLVSMLAIITLNSLDSNGLALGHIKNEPLLYIMAVVVILNCLLTFREALTLSKNKWQNQELIQTLDQLEHLNRTLRAQRHDFMNQLQVVFSLMEMDEYSDAKDFIQKVYTDIQRVSNVLKTANPAVNALLQAKLLYAEKRGIEVQLIIKTQLKALKIPTWEFCRVLGNIIDNGIYELQSVAYKGIIIIEIFESLQSYGFRIKNNGPRIPENIMSKIFDPEFTTKGAEGEGMGLAIVKEIMENYQGEIKVISTAEETVFEGLVQR